MGARENGSWEPLDKALLIKDREGGKEHYADGTELFFDYIFTQKLKHNVHNAWAQATNCSVPLNAAGIPGDVPCSQKGLNARIEYLN